MQPVIPRTTLDNPAIPRLAIVTAFAQSLDLLEYWVDLIRKARARKRERWLSRENNKSKSRANWHEQTDRAKACFGVVEPLRRKNTPSNAEKRNSSFHCSPYISAYIRTSLTSLQSSYQASQEGDVSSGVNWRLGCCENWGKFMRNYANAGVIVGLFKMTTSY